MATKYESAYQFLLIFFAFLVLFGVGVFIYYEVFPEYKIYQYAYKDLEEFRASYTGEAPAPFKTGIKQILLPNKEQGPELVDRCISCHIAIDLPHFSPTRLALDVNDQPMIDAQGNPILEPNPDYVWTHLDARIEELANPTLIQQMRAQGDDRGADARISVAEELKELKTRGIPTALKAHPLIGAEKHPFEFHPLEEYGCTSCHSGKGAALVARRAHGPVYDGDYEKAFEGPKPQFLEKDLENDPLFARMYNDKPGHDLIFQTTPMLTGPLIAAKCVQCHQSSSAEAQATIEKLDIFTSKKGEQLASLQKGIETDRKALVSLVALEHSLGERGYVGTVDWLNTQLGNDRLTEEEIDAYEGQLAYVERYPERLHEQLAVDLLRTQQQLVAKQEALAQDEPAYTRFTRAKEPFERIATKRSLVEQMNTDLDTLIASYTRGKELYISQACYACHRIAGFSRSSVGPELTTAGLNYPWFIKESIVWPQADLPSSTMPNFRLDHEELADLMTFLMAQTGETKAISEVDYQISLNEWEMGKKMPWEKPIPPTQIEDVRAGMHVFVTEGCAACHKLEGFESTVGLADDTYEEREWFYALFPEQIPGSAIATAVVEHASEIDTKIIEGVREDGVIEEIEARYPGLVWGFYSNFKFAQRAMNTAYAEEPEKLAAYQRRLNKVLMVYIEQYGLGRDIAPHLNYSGVYRDDAWLLGHFHNPSAYTAKSIMPVMPFDNTKFYQLNHLLHVLGRKNRNKLNQLWEKEGFNPPLAYELLCSSCHGEFRQGNGIISEWIYPIPKNLRNPVFLRNLTRRRAIDSITHGVRGTPMPPWGESVEQADFIPVLNHSQITQLVDWLYQGLPPEPRQESMEDYEKWTYSPADVVEEMEAERTLLPPPPPKGETIEELVHDYFEVRPNPNPSIDKELFYIREQYYTPENLAAGEAFFQVNCATCHGKEGTGTGLRASSMVEAKPRMLTNLPWIRTRDDLRLLRSIKYGVPGTAMIPWGDQTSSALRMQLVMFIRELTRGQIFRDDLEDLLYDAFDRPELAVEKARAVEYAVLEEKRRALREIEERLFDLTEEGKAPPEEIAQIYVEEITLKREVSEAEARDAQYKKLIALLNEERKIFFTLGDQVIAARLSEDLVEQYFAIIRNVPLRLTFEGGELIVSSSAASREKSAQLLEALTESLDRKIASYQKEIDREWDRIRVPERGKEIEQLLGDQGVYINLRTQLNVELSDAAALRTEQRHLLTELQKNPTSQ